jgi:diadenosine tetraphosphate (Ap4A) HIT family hydrolase
MAIIYESKNFVVESAEKPHVDRNDGGHIIIASKIKILDRQHLSTKQAIELMRLTIVAGQAMTDAMNKNGVDIGRINYQDNGNWSVFKPEGPKLHIHLYGRAKSAKYHKYGQACYFPHIAENPEYYARFQPLNSKDIKDIHNEILKLFKQKNFSDAEWKLRISSKLYKSTNPR